MLNQIQLDLGLPFVVDPQNLPIWANQMTVSVESQWGLLASRVNNLIPKDGSEGLAWTAFTPTITASSGTFTSVSATGRYLKIERTVFIELAITITTNGTAAGGIIASPLPFTAGVGSAIIYGRANQISGKMLQGIIQGGTASTTIFNYDNTYAGATGEILILTGFYEANQ